MSRFAWPFLLAAWFVGILELFAADQEPTAGVVQPVKPSAGPLKTSADGFTLSDLPPAKRIVLYSSGVGHIQHLGRVRGNAKFQIPFSGHDVDDVLKSLVFEDRGGGHIKAVEYQPAPEAEDIAANDLGDPMTLAQLLQRFRGEVVTVAQGTSKLQGTIYGVENRQVGDQSTEFLVLMNDQGLQSVSLADVDQFRFDSPQVRDQLQLAMTGIVKLRKTGNRQLTLLFEGEGERDVQFAYVIDAPIWRMTYRVSVDQKGVTLQGWAHVDNVMGVDWDQVQLELRSGRPHIFHAEVFAPVMAERRSVGLDVFDLPRGLTLVSQWFGFEGPTRYGSDTGFGGGMGGMGGGMGGMGGGDPTGAAGAAAVPRSDGLDIVAAIRAAGDQKQAQDVVQVKLAAPVSLRSGRSAALPVFAEQLPGSLITRLTFTGNEPEAWRAIELTNSTSSSLVGGPVNVVLDGNFVGDGILERLAIQGVGNVVYSVDRSLKARHSISEPRRALTELRRQKQELELVYRGEYEASLELHNTEAAQRRIQVRYPMPKDKYRIEAPSPDRIEGQLNLYSLQIESQGTSQLKLTIVREELERVPLETASSVNLHEWLAGSAKVSRSLRELLSGVLVLTEQLEAKEAESAGLQTTRRRLMDEQQRARQNLQAVDSKTEAAQPFLARLTKTETLIQEVDQTIDRSLVVIKQLTSRRRSVLGAPGP